MDRFQNTRQPDWDWWSKLWPTPGETLRLLGVRSDASLVEVGSGNGYFALPAARIVDPAPVYAVDLDEALLDELDHLAAQQGIENVDAVCGDARSLSMLLPEPVEVCLLANTLHGVDDPASLVEVVHDSLVPDGAFVVVNWAALPRETTTVDGLPRGPPTDLRLRPAETRRLIEATSAFTQTRRVDLPPYHYALVFER